MGSVWHRFCAQWRHTVSHCERDETPSPYQSIPAKRHTASQSMNHTAPHTWCHVLSCLTCLVSCRSAALTGYLVSSHPISVVLQCCVVSSHLISAAVMCCVVSSRLISATVLCCLISSHQCCSVVLAHLISAAVLSHLLSLHVVWWFYKCCSVASSHLIHLISCGGVVVIS